MRSGPDRDSQKKPSDRECPRRTSPDDGSHRFQFAKHAKRNYRDLLPFRSRSEAFSLPAILNMGSPFLSLSGTLSNCFFSFLSLMIIVPSYHTGHRLRFGGPMRVAHAMFGQAGGPQCVQQIGLVHVGFRLDLFCGSGQQ